MNDMFEQAPEILSITILNLSQGAYLVILTSAGGTAGKSRHFFSSLEGAFAFATSYGVPIRNLTHNERVEEHGR